MSEGPLALTFQRDHVVLPDGYRVAVVVTGDADLSALDPHAVAKVQHAFSSLVDSLSMPLQLLVRARRWSDSDDVAWTADDRSITTHARQHLVRHRPLRRRVFIALVAERPAELGWRIEGLIRTLEAVGMSGQRLEGADLHGLYDEMRQPWRMNRRHITSVRGVARGYLLRRFPGVDVSVDWLHPLLSAPVVSDIAVHIRPVSTADALNVLGKRLRDQTSQQMIDSDAGRVQSVHAAIAVDSIEDLRERIAGNHARPVEMAVIAVVRAETADRLAAASSALTSAWAATAARATPCHFHHDAALLSVQPLGLNAFARWKLADSVAAATVLPWAQVTIDDPHGYRLGHGRGDHGPISLDPFAVGRGTNANVAVIATSGHGKSFALSTLMLEARRRGREVVVLDPEGEYRWLSRENRGTYIDLTPGSTSSLNVFETGLTVAETAAAVLEVVALLCGGLNPGERAVVDAAAHHLLDGTGAAPVLGDLLSPLEQTAPHIASILARHCHGPSGMLLSRPTTIASNGTPFLGLGYRDLPNELAPTVTYIVAQWLWTLIRRHQCPRHVVVDEVGLMLDHPELRHLLVQLARRCRKYDASLVVATQNAADLFAAPDITVIPTNAATVLLGGQRAVDVDVMTAAFGLTANQARFLEAARRGEFLLLSGHRRVEMVVDVPQSYHDIITGRAP